MIERGSQLSVTRQCDILDLNRTGVYYTPRPISEADLKLMRRIDELHLEQPFEGAGRPVRRQRARLIRSLGRCLGTGRLTHPAILAAHRSERGRARIDSAEVSL